VLPERLTQNLTWFMGETSLGLCDIAVVERRSSLGRGSQTRAGPQSAALSAVRASPAQAGSGLFESASALQRSAGSWLQRQGLHSQITACIEASAHQVASAGSLVRE